MKEITSLKDVLMQLATDSHTADKPDAVINSFTDLTEDFFKEKEIQYLIVDLDQTIVVQGGKDIPKDFFSTLEILKTYLGNEKICFLTNEPNKIREENITSRTGIRVVSGNFRKPQSRAYKEALKHLGVKPSKYVAMVGDRVWTDIVGANRLGIFTIQVKPLSPQRDSFAVSLLRRSEILSQRSGISALVKLALALLTLSGMGIIQFSSVLISATSRNFREILDITSHFTLIVHVIFIFSSLFYFLRITNEKAKISGGEWRNSIITYFNTYPAFFRLLLSYSLLAYSISILYFDIGQGDNIKPDRMLGIAMFYSFIVHLSLLFSLTSLYHSSASRLVRIFLDVSVVLVLAFFLPEILDPFALTLLAIPVGTAARYFDRTITLTTVSGCAIVTVVILKGNLDIAAITIFFQALIALILKFEYKESVTPIDMTIQMHCNSPKIFEDIFSLLKSCTKVLHCMGVFYIKDIHNGYYYTDDVGEYYDRLNKTSNEEIFNFLEGHSAHIMQNYNITESSLKHQDILAKNIEYVLRPPVSEGVISIIAIRMPHSASGYMLAVNNLTRNGVVRRRFSLRHARTLFLFALFMFYLEKREPNIDLQHTVEASAT